MTDLLRHAIFGLGNPGSTYTRTRHNLGFMVIEALHKKILGPEPAMRMYETAKDKHSSYYWKLDWEHATQTHQLLLIQPQTFMNRSGRAVQQVLQFYKLPPKQALIIYDDISLPFGTMKIKESGSSGGHNGMASVIENIGPKIARLKCGIAPMEMEGRKSPSINYDLKRYVLEPFNVHEQAIVVDYAEKLADVVLSIISKGISQTMTKCHGKVYTEWPRIGGR